MSHSYLELTSSCLVQTLPALINVVLPELVLPLLPSTIVCPSVEEKGFM
ncbi:hypothetical protein U2F15_18870 [Acinetobacter baumannii]